MKLFPLLLFTLVLIIASDSFALSGPPKENYTPLQIAVRKGDVAEVIKLLKQGANPNIADYRGQTPLHWIIPNVVENIDMAKALIKYGADVNSIDKRNKYTCTPWIYDEGGRTPLHLAALFGKKEIASLLIGRGADINARDDNGKTPLHLAAFAGHIDMCRFLLDKGANINAKDDAGVTPLSDTEAGILPYFKEKEIKRQKDIINLLISKGAGSTLQDFGPNDLHIAASIGDIDACRLLLSKGADINGRFSGGHSKGERPLHLAVRNNHKDIVDYLLDRGAVVDAKDGEGETPLHYAAQQGNLAIVKLLLSRKADILARDDNYGWVPLHLAAISGHSDVVAYFLDKGMDVDIKSSYGRTALHEAVRSPSNYETVKILIVHNANVKLPDDGGQTPLHFAAQNSLGNAATTKLLLSKGAEVNARDNEEKTPLHIAAMDCSRGAAYALLANGADVNAKDKFGKTPLHLAALFSGCFDNESAVVELLISHGADVNIKDKSGQTPLTNAKFRPKISAILRRAGAKE